MSDRRPHDDTFNRPPRIRRTYRVETVELPEPPLPPQRPDGEGWISIGMPLLSAGVMVVATAAIYRGGYGLLFGVPMAIMAVMGVATPLVMNRMRVKRAAAEFKQRQMFFEAQVREKHAHLQELYDEELRIRREAHPNLEELLRIAGALGTGMQPQERFWERRVGDPDFLEFAVGPGQIPFSTAIKVPAPRPDSAVDLRLFELERRYRMLHDVPITIFLCEVGSLGVAGPRNEGLALLRALIWQAAVFHAPTELRIALVAPGDAADEWDWVPWLPHTVPLTNDEDFRARMFAREEGSVDQLMSDLLDQVSRRRDLLEQQKHEDTALPLTFPPLLLILDGMERVRDQPALGEIMRHGTRYNMFVLLLVRNWEEIPGECGAMLDLPPHAPRWARAGGQWSSEPFTVETAEATVRRSNVLAKKLAPLKVATSGSSQEVPRRVRLFEVLGIKNEQDLRPPRFWSEPPQRGWNPAPIGLKAAGLPFCIDFHELAQGPHALIAGTTGAGKSVLLQSLIASLAISHSPTLLNLLLVDFKGGASLAQLARLPHTVGFVTNLEGRMAERAMTAIRSEMRRRMPLFRSGATSIKSKIETIGEYREKARGMQPLPQLLIVIDEFDELVQSHRDFVTELVRVVKQGRALGVHLLFASQQPAKAVTEDIRTQLKSFVALRLGSSEDSRVMLEKPDAAFLPVDIPGRAYFRVGSETTLLQVAQVTGPYQPGNDIRSTQLDFISIPELVQEHLPDAPSKPISNPTNQITDLDVLLAALEQAGADFFRQSGWKPCPIWQPPLPPRLALSEVIPVNTQNLPQELARAWNKPIVREAWLHVPIGRLDIPQESRQEPMSISLADAHLAVVGASGSGKTLLLRTLLLSLALAHSPQDVWLYVVDGGGHGLSPFANLPHVGGVIQARDGQRVRRLISLIDREILERQELFRKTGANDLVAYRQAQGCQIPAWVVLINRIALLREEFKDRSGYETITEDLVRLARVGRTYGIHFVVTADSARDMTYQLLSLFDARIALRLPDLHDYNEVLGERVISQIPAALPGRGLWLHPEQGILELQVALPTLEQPNSATAVDMDGGAVLNSDLNADLRETLARIRALWQRSPIAAVWPEPVELLPDQVTIQQFNPRYLERRELEDVICVPIGKESVHLGVGYMRFSRTVPHNLITGGKRSGKTTALQMILIGLAHRYSETDVRFIIVDSGRRGLWALKDLPHTDTYAVTEAEVLEVVRRLKQIQTHDSISDMCHWVIAVDDYEVGYNRTPLNLVLEPRPLAIVVVADFSSEMKDQNAPGHTRVDSMVEQIKRVIGSLSPESPVSLITFDITARGSTATATVRVDRIPPKISVRVPAPVLQGRAALRVDIVYAQRPIKQIEYFLNSQSIGVSTVPPDFASYLAIADLFTHGRPLGANPDPNKQYELSAVATDVDGQESTRSNAELVRLIPPAQPMMPLTMIIVLIALVLILVLTLVIAAIGYFHLRQRQSQADSRNSFDLFKESDTQYLRQAARISPAPADDKVSVSGSVPTSN